MRTVRPGRSRRAVPRRHLPPHGLLGAHRRLLRASHLRRWRHSRRRQPRRHHLILVSVRRLPLVLRILTGMLAGVRALVSPGVRPGMHRVGRLRRAVHARPGRSGIVHRMRRWRRRVILRMRHVHRMRRLMRVMRHVLNMRRHVSTERWRGRRRHRVPELLYVY